MESFFKKIKNILLYGGLTREEYGHNIAMITQTNQHTLKTLSLISLIGFIIAILLTSLNASLDIRRLVTFLICIGFMLVILGVCNVAKENRHVINFCVYLFTIVLYMAGIYISAVIGISDLATTYMVFLFVVPLLFIARPVFIDLLIFFTNTFFIASLHLMGQNPELLHKNEVNAIIYGLLSVVIVTYMMQIKYERMNRGWENRYLSETDQLTGLPNRRSYERCLQEINKRENCENYIVALLDINGLKETNDHFGHDAGDELIRGAADCITSCFGKYGKVFRTGGDEFVAILFAPTEPEALLSALEKATAAWKGTSVKILSLSSGFTEHKEFPSESIYEMIKIADRRMYDAKAAYYKNRGIDRRGQGAGR